ncbi:methyltransferase-like protein 7A [Stylophora pistillata]|nr:methyltransferase-like protein 7A [Stylophora pistillata]XP_022805124.1 methyltransferase-like protein 7A [Stylophora pistillata]XP_022805125.1 methyltransferase-like protein 7A [Stylophora pistillata]
MIVLGICAVVIVVFAITAAMSDKLREAVISSKTYKKGFAVHMNLFSRIHNSAVRKHKEDIFEKLKPCAESVGGGDILEIGAGTGANFEFFPEGSSIIALEPNRHMVPYLQENAQKFPHVQLKEIVLGFAEKMEGIPDESVAAVVCTLTLCSVSDVDTTLSEIKRVLKPGGYFYFLEHVADETETWRNSLQRRFDKQWKYLSDGCSCSRETWTHLDNAGFSTVSYKKFDLKELIVLCYLMRPHLAGYAIK